MKNIFSVFGTQNTSSNEQPAALDLNEQDLELVNGACGDRRYDDDDCYSDCDDWDYDHSREWNHRHHRHHRHND